MDVNLPGGGGNKNWYFVMNNQFINWNNKNAVFLEEYLFPDGITSG